MNKLKLPSGLVNVTSIVTVICFIAIILLTIFLVLPKIQDLITVQNNVRTAKVEYKNRQEYVVELEQLKAELDEHRENVEKVKTILPNNPSVPSFLNYLQQVASGSGLILNEISPFQVSSAMEFEGLKQTNINIKVTGTFPAFKSFVINLERSARLIEVEDISFASGQSVGSVEEGETVSTSGTFSFSVKLKTFSY